MNDSSYQLEIGQVWKTIDDQLAFQCDRDPPGAARGSSLYSFVRLAEGSPIILEREIEPPSRIVDERDGRYVLTMPAVWQAYCWSIQGKVVSRDLIQHARRQD